MWTLQTVNVQSVLLVDCMGEAALPALYTGILCTLGHTPLMRTSEGCESSIQTNLTCWCRHLTRNTHTPALSSAQTTFAPMPRHQSLPHWPWCGMKLKGLFPAPSFTHQSCAVQGRPEKIPRTNTCEHMLGVQRCAHMVSGCGLHHPWAQSHYLRHNLPQ